MKFIDMIATTIEQSKKLLELGLNPETADMMHFFGKNKPQEMYLDVIDGETIKYENLRDYMHYGTGLPAWSLSALLELIPKFITEKSEKYLLRIIPTNNNQIEMCYWNKFSGGLISDYIRKDSFMESAYNMTVWLLENGYIKK